MRTILRTLLVPLLLIACSKETEETNRGIEQHSSSRVEKNCFTIESDSIIDQPLYRVVQYLKLNSDELHAVSEDDVVFAISTRKQLKSYWLLFEQIPQDDYNDDSMDIVVTGVVIQNNDGVIIYGYGRHEHLDFSAPPWTWI